MSPISRSSLDCPTPASLGDHPSRGPTLRMSRSIDLLRSKPKASAAPFQSHEAPQQRNTSYPLKRSKSSANVTISAPIANFTPTSSFLQQHQQPQPSFSDASPAQGLSRPTSPVPTNKIGSLKRKVSTLFKPKLSHKSSTISSRYSRDGRRPSLAPTDETHAELGMQPPAVPSRPDKPVLRPSSPLPVTQLSHPQLSEFPFPKQNSPQSSSSKAPSTPSLGATFLRRRGVSARPSLRHGSLTSSSESSSRTSSPVPRQSMRKSSWLPRALSNAASGTRRSVETDRRISVGSLAPSLQAVEESCETPWTPSLMESELQQSEPGQPTSPGLSVNTRCSSGEQGQSGWSDFSSQASSTRGFRMAPRALTRKLSKTLSKSFDNLRLARSPSLGSMEALEASFEIVAAPATNTIKHSPRPEVAASIPLPAESPASNAPRRPDANRSDTFNAQLSRHSTDASICHSATTELAGMVTELEKSPVRPYSLASDSSSSLDEQPANHYSSPPRQASEEADAPKRDSSSFFISYADADRRGSSFTCSDGSTSSIDSTSIAQLQQLRTAPCIEDYVSSSPESLQPAKFGRSWRSLRIGSDPYQHSPRVSYDTCPTSMDLDGPEDAFCGNDTNDLSASVRERLEVARPSVGDRMVERIDAGVNLVSLASEATTPNSTRYFKTDSPMCFPAFRLPNQLALPNVHLSPTSKRSSFMSEVSVLAAGVPLPHKTRTSLRRYSADTTNMRPREVEEVPPLPAAPGTEFKLPPSVAHQRHRQSLDVPEYTDNVTKASQVSIVSYSSPCPAPKGRVAMLTGRFEALRESHTETPMEQLKAPPAARRSLQTAPSNKRQSIAGQTITEEPSLSYDEPPPPEHDVRQSGIPSDQHSPKSFHSDRQHLPDENVWLEFLHEAEVALEDSHLRFPSTTWSQRELFKFQAPILISDIMQFLDDSQARFREEAFQHTPGRDSLASPPKMPCSAFDSDPEDTGELSTTGVLPLPKGPQRASQASSLSSKSTSGRMPMESTSRFDHRGIAIHRLSGLSDISAVPEEPVVTRAALRPVLTPKTLKNGMPSEPDYLSGPIDKERRDAFDFAASKLEGCLPMVAKGQMNAPSPNALRKKPRPGRAPSRRGPSKPMSALPPTDISPSKDARARSSAMLRMR